MLRRFRVGRTRGESSREIFALRGRTQNGGTSSRCESSIDLDLPGAGRDHFQICTSTCLSLGRIREYLNTGKNLASLRLDKRASMKTAAVRVGEIENHLRDFSPLSWRNIPSNVSVVRKSREVESLTSKAALRTHRKLPSSASRYLLSEMLSDKRVAFVAPRRQAPQTLRWRRTESPSSFVFVGFRRT